MGKGQTEDRDSQPAELENMVREVEANAYDPSEKPFDYLLEGEKTALLCEQDATAKEKIKNVLKGMGYRVAEAASARNALKYMRFQTYDMVILNETFEAAGADSNHVLQYLAQLPIINRRNIFVCLVGKDFNTMDNMMAFHRSVNLVVNLGDLDEIGKILSGALTEHENFYQVFWDSMKKAGRV
jgi:CheY-like chemotaxis protein